MKIVLATPLYPPEVADAAVYVKELARRLTQNHKVTVVAYAHLPEQMPGVTVVAVDKRRPRLARLRAFRKALVHASHTADAVIAINGVSVELPILLSSLPKTIFCLADKAAHERARLIERFAFARACMVVREVPDTKPEILPLEPEPKEALAVWERAWQEHLRTLENILTHGN